MPERRRQRADRLLAAVTRGLGAVAGGVVLLIAFFLLRESLPLLGRVGLLPFAGASAWHPTAGRYALGAMLAGTLLAAAGAVLLATPLGVASAIYCQCYAGARTARACRALLALLAGVPSVVYGLWGLVTLVPLIRRLEPPGPSLLAGILVLAVMILPTVALLADAALGAVPRETLQAAAALGLSQARTVLAVQLPAARHGIATGVLLQTGRALGETMAVLMVCGNVVQLPDSLLAPVRTLTANIALEMAYALDDHRAALFVSGLLLLLLVAVLVTAADTLTRGRLDA